MVAISLRAVVKRFSDGTEAPAGLDLEIADGELLTLVGPSGCGKTTVLRLIAGLDTPTSGTVLFDGMPVDDVPPRSRDVAMVFQDGALFGHLSTRDNIGFPLVVRGVERDEIEQRVDAEAAHVGVRTLLAAKPKQLSAGHRHAVATARAIIRESSAFLLDEPLASLDARARIRVRSQVVRLHQELGTTMVYVTNDTAEAMAIGERMAVLDEHGRLRQVGSPTSLYNQPADTFVAGLVGSINLVLSTIESEPDGDWIVLGNDRIRLAPGDDQPPAQDRQVIVGVRPEHLVPSGSGSPFDRCLHGRVRSVADLGADLELSVELGESTVAARFRRHRTYVRGDPIELVIEPGRLLFFDPADGTLIPSQ